MEEIQVHDEASLAREFVRGIHIREQEAAARQVRNARIGEALRDVGGGQAKEEPPGVNQIDP